MVGDMIMDDHFIITEVGAYEAIHSDRDRDQLSTGTTTPMYDHQSILGRANDAMQELSELGDINDDHYEHAQQFVTSDDAESSDTKTIEPVQQSLPTSAAAGSAVPKGPRTIKCPQCRRYFATDAELVTHTQVRHSPEMNERFKCYECQQGFSSQGSLYKHQKIHTGERPFVCETCQRSFNQLANLQRHFMVHTGEKPFACKTCGKQFSQQSNVDKHQVTHSKVKPFSCNICNKQFTQRANLQKHERVHTGERPYVCPICRKGYAQHANMKKHVLSHNKANDTMAYLCAKCKKLYDTVLLYDAHLDFCDVDNQDYNFELVTGVLEDVGAGHDGVDGVGDVEAGHILNADLCMGGVSGDGGVGDESNRINMLNVIKTESNGLDDLMIEDDDSDPLLMQHVEYLDD